MNATIALNLLSVVIDSYSDGPSILQWDSLGMLIPLTFALPGLFAGKDPTPTPTGEVLEQHTLRLIFLSHIVRILLTMEASELENLMDTEDCEDDRLIFEVLNAMNKTFEGYSALSIWKCVQSSALPFLRCCVLFYHFLTDVPAPPSLQEVGGDTFVNMCAYLDLPTNPKELFSSPGKRFRNSYLNFAFKYHVNQYRYVTNTCLYSSFHVMVTRHLFKIVFKLKSFS